MPSEESTGRRCSRPEDCLSQAVSYSAPGAGLGKLDLRTGTGAELSMGSGALNKSRETPFSRDAGMGTRKLRRPNEKMRLLVAQSLRNLKKPDLLEESEIVDIMHIHAAEGDTYFPRGLALAEMVIGGAKVVVERTAGIERFHRHRALLMAVLEGSSIASWAEGEGLSREHVSRSIWRYATALVTRELLRLSVPC